MKKGPALEFVTVFESGSASFTAIAKSILDGANIQYFVRDENVQHILGLGVTGIGYNPITGPAQIQVFARDERKAKQLLSDLEEQKNAAT